MDGHRHAVLRRVLRREPLDGVLEQAAADSRRAPLRDHEQVDDLAVALGHVGRIVLLDAGVQESHQLVAVLGHEEGGRAIGQEHLAMLGGQASRPRCRREPCVLFVLVLAQVLPERLDGLEIAPSGPAHDDRNAWARIPGARHA